jgi:Protein of unknown function (DUF3105)
MSKAKANERRAKLEEVQREHQTADRRRNLLFGGIGGVLALAIIGGSIAAVQQVEANKPENKALTAFGVPATEASCTEFLTTKSGDVNNHVPPVDGEGNPTVIKYATVPPSFGPHFDAPAPFERDFYTERDRPAMETLVHNLEHGYVVVWYDPDLPPAQADDLRGVVQKLRSQPETRKVIASAWDNSYGTLTDGAQIAMSHWGTKNGTRQLCGQVSGEAINAFVQAHPPTGSPEPFAA